MLKRSILTFSCLLALSACGSSQDEEPVTISVPDQAREEITTTTAPREGLQSGEYLPSAIAGTQEDLTVNVGDRVHFDYDSYSLSDEARQTLMAQARWLNQYPHLSVIVEGHCDERGTREYNLALGERRASSAKDYLIALGVAPSRIQVISYGKERPIAAGSDAQSWAQNRRAVTVIQ